MKLLCLLIILCAFATTALASGLTGTRIYIDPGHGGTDSGAVGPTGLREKDITLQVSLTLRDLLTRYQGATVRMSREDDRTLTLSQRSSDANSWGAHYLVSVHFNGATNSSANGTETFVGTSVGVNQPAYRLAQAVQKRMLEWGNLPNRGVKQANFHMVTRPTMPSILTEGSFVTNPQEEARLRDQRYIWRHSYYIYLGFTDFFGVNP